MTSIDPRSVAYAISAVCVLIWLVISISRRRARHVAGLLMWEWGALALGAGLLLNAMQKTHTLPFGEFLPVVAGNIGMLYGIGLVWAGIRQFRGLPSGLALVHLAVGFGGICSAVFLIPLPNFGARAIVVSALAAFFLISSALILWRERPAHLSALLQLAGLACSVMAGLMLLRIGMTLVLGAPLHSLERAQVNGMTYLLGSIAMVTIYVCLLLCTHAQLLHDVSRLVAEDDMTGALNRRGLYYAAPKWIEQHGERAAALVIDVDHFKLVNDSFGHAKGDELLQALVRAANSSLPASSLFARMGGDEFVALIADKNQLQSTTLALRRDFAEAAQRLTDQRIPTPSLTIGTASLGADLAQTLHRADAALYAAKAAGRNRIAEATLLGH